MMLLRLTFSIIAGLLLAGLASHLLCDAPNPTLANPAYCAQREWLTWTTAFLVGAGLVWLWQLRRRIRPGAASAGEVPAAA